MRLYRIMVVDDEEEIRLGIIKKIDWKGNGFEVVGDSENGKDALEKAEIIQPDVVLTDIRMPFMNGLELGKNLAKILPATKVVIFSGSDDFEYAHEAIKINVVEYVLKPVDAKELTEVLKRIKIILDKEYEDKLNIDKLYKHYIESAPLIREQFLVGLIEGCIGKEDFEQQSGLLDIDFKLSCCISSIVHVDNYYSSSSNEYSSLQKEVTLIPIAIKQIVDERFQINFESISFIYCGKVVIIAKLKEREDILNFINEINNVCKISERIVGLKVSAGIGSICENLLNINYSYETAKNSLDYRIVLGTGKGIYIDDVEPNNNIKLQFDEQDERKMLNSIKIGTKQEIQKVINEIFSKCGDHVFELNKYRIFLMEIMTAMLKLIQTYNIEIDEVFGENFNCYSYIDSFDSLFEIKDWFIKNSIKVNDLIKSERIHSSKLLVEKAKNFVFENYYDYDISVEVLSNYLHVSPTYFSTIFKRETEMNFVNFLTTVRLEEAIKLLNTTDDKTYIIAGKVGYQEANYFSYVFKRKYGVAPSRYRKK